MNPTNKTTALARDAELYATDPDYRDAAQQDYESAVEEHELQQAYERYDGPLSWSVWSAQQRAKWYGE